MDDYYSITKEVESRYKMIVKQDEADKRKEDNARKQRELEYRQKKAQEQAEFRQRMIAKYGSEKGSLVANKQISIGMTQEMCKDSWGRPMNTYRTTTKYGQSEVWCYNYKTRVYFFDGKVVQIDN